MDSLLGHKKLDTAKGTEHARPQEREGLASPSGEQRRDWGWGPGAGAGLEKRSRRKAGSHLMDLRSGMEI